MKNKKLNFALVGCGRIATRKHAPVLANELQEAELVAVCDIIPEKAKKLGRAYDVPFYVDYHEMAEKHPEIDVFNILTEGGNHTKPVVDLAKYGKHFVIEKPMALKIEDADKMLKVTKKNNSRLFVVMQNRYNYPVMKLKEAIDQGRFGKIFMGTIRVRWCREQKYFDMDAWRGTWKLDGGVFASQASHHLDLLEWLVGDIESVFAKTANVFADIEAEDTGVVVVKFKNGALGTIEATNATRPTDVEGSVSVLGEKGMVEIGGFAVNEMKIWQFKRRRVLDDEAVNKYRTAPPSVYGFGHQQYLRDVIKAIVNNKPAFVDGEIGRKDLNLTHAIYKSVETGKEVFLDSNPKSKLLGKYVPKN